VTDPTCRPKLRSDPGAGEKSDRYFSRACRQRGRI
jgi:hypothetical protein